MSSSLPIDLTVNAWSSAGSYLQVRSPTAPIKSRDVPWPVRLQSCRRSVWGAAGNYGCGRTDLFDLHLINEHGHRLPYRAEATAAELRLVSETGGVVRLVFCGTDAIAVHLEGIGLLLDGCKPQGWWNQPADGWLMIYDALASETIVIGCDQPDGLRLEERIHEPAETSRNGVETKIASVRLHPGRSPAGAVISLHCIEPPREELVVPDYDAALRTKRREIEAWMVRMPAVPAEFEQAAQYAWHTLWHHRVGPRGLLKRPTIIMGRLWMNITWPWDAAFAALGVGEADVDLAFDQLMLHFDHHAESGQICDHLHDAEASFGFLKPPVQGWVVGQLIDQCGVERCRHRLTELYEPMLRWTEWWYKYRDDDRDGMCQYNHGNDSGWDNSTVFDKGMPTEGVDLAAYLVLQWEALADIADILCRPADASRWRARAAEQLQTLLRHGVVDGSLTSRRSGDHTRQATTSLITRLPILLGDRLPEALRRQIIADLQADGPWLTAYGPATESTESAKYVEDSYWRGPIWAPPTYMLFDGLRSMGETHLAAEIARRFCNTVASQPGMYENYSATNGRGLRCPTYAWTAAVFIRLAEWLHEHDPHLHRPVRVPRARLGAAGGR